MHKFGHNTYEQNELQFEIISTFIEAHDNPSYKKPLRTSTIVYAAALNLIRVCSNLPLTIECCNRFLLYSKSCFKFKDVIDKKFNGNTINTSAILFRAAFFASCGDVEKGRYILDRYLSLDNNNGLNEPFAVFMFAIYSLLSVSHDNDNGSKNDGKVENSTTTITTTTSTTTNTITPATTTTTNNDDHKMLSKAFELFQKYGSLKRQVVLQNTDNDNHVVQEVWYNIGCAYHEIGLLNMAIPSYIHAIIGSKNKKEVTTTELLKYLNKLKKKKAKENINITRQAALNLNQILLLQNKEIKLINKLRRTFLTF